MKTKYLIFFSILTVFSILTSCGSGKPRATSANDLFHLKQGMKYSKVDSLFNIKDQINYDIEFDNQKYTIAVTSIKNYFFKDETPTKTAGSSSQNINISEIGVDEMYLIFKDRTLVNWSYLYELKNDVSERNNQFGLAIYDGFMNFYNSKKR